MRGKTYITFVVLALTPVAFAADEPASLQAKFGPRFLVGVALGGLVPDDYSPAERRLILEQFGGVTPENCMKMAALQPREGEFHFDEADALVDFAEKHRLQVAGHTLIWARDENTPRWFFRDGDEPASRELLLSRLETHVKTVVSRYRGRVVSWDVVNEAIDDGGAYLRPSGWLSIVGPEYIAKAFEWAREADPDALLIYNDYSVEQPRKREKLVRLIRELQGRKAPLGAVGIQGHWEIDRVPFRDVEDLIATLDGLGLKTIVSELDLGLVPRGPWWEDGGRRRAEIAGTDSLAGACPPELLERQADQYARLFRLFLAHSGSIERVTFWNLHDGRSWLNYFPWRRTEHPLLFDRDVAPKPAFRAVMKIEEAR
jgi:endo-1,4-beta-xylanase